MRIFRQSPTFVALTLTTLSLAVGANVVVFALANALWLRHPAVADPDRVVVVSTLPAVAAALAPGAAAPMNDMMSDQDLAFLREQTVFEGAAGQVGAGGLMGFFRSQLVLEAVSREVETLGVTPEYFAVLGLSPLGRDFIADDDRLLAPPVLIISHRLWQEGFGGRPDAIGSTVESAQGPVQIVGVAPPGFHGARRGEQVDAWVPRRAAARFGPSARAFVISPEKPGAILGPLLEDPPMVVLARLRRDVTALQAEQAIAARPSGRDRMVVRPLRAVYGAPHITTLELNERRVGQVIAVTSALVLLAGCTTLAALVLMHYERRRRDLVIRLALGSSRTGLAARLVGELAILALAGASGGIFVAHWSLALLPALSLPGGVDLSRLDLSVDAAALTLAAGVSVLAMLTAGLVPVARFTRAPLAADLSASPQTTAPSLLRFRQALLAVHAAATTLLVVSAGLFVQTMVYGLNQGAGFDLEGTLFVRLQPNLLSFMDDDGGEDRIEARKRAAYKRLRSELESLPGVEAVAEGESPLRPDVTITLPTTTSIRLPAERVEYELPVWLSRGGPGYAEALGLPLLAGRWLGPVDVGTGRVLLTRTLADTLWPDESPLGRVLELQWGGRQRFEVVGIVPDFAQRSIRHGVRNGIIGVAPVNITAGDPIEFHLTVATRARADTLVREVRRVTEAAFPSSASLAIDTGRELVSRDLGQARLGAWFFSGFGLIVLGLGLASVFGLVAYVAESRRRDMGVRLALGATTRDLIRQMVSTGLWPVAIGGIVGLGLTALVADGVSALLHGVGRLDPATCAGAFLLILGGSVAAGWLAALRLTYVQPAEVLRAE